MPFFDDNQSAPDIQREKLNFIALEYHKQYADTLFCIEHASWYSWGGKIYHQKDELEIMTVLSDRMPGVLEMSIKKRREILDNLKSLCWIKSEELNKEEGFALENGFYSIARKELLAHDKRRITTILLDYQYDPATLCPKWLETLDKIFEGDRNKIHCLQEFFGYCLTRDTNYEKALIMLGEGATGKSTILNALTSVIGKDNICSVGLKNIAEGKHTARLENKLVNTCSEMPRRAADYEGEFRAIVTGELIEADQKWVKTYEFRPFCKMIFAANTLPYIDDPTNAFYRRLLLLDLNNPIDEASQNKNLSKELYEERAGILNWAIAGLKRLQIRERFHIDEYMQARITEIKLQNNPIAAWAFENIEIKKGMELEKSDVYARYVTWVKENGYNQIGISKFGAQFWILFQKHTQKNYRRPPGTDRKYVWPGLAWRTETETKEEQVEWEE